MAKQLLGKEVTEALNKRILLKISALSEKGIVPKLSIMRIGENPSDISYERGAIKRAEALGIETDIILLPEASTRDELIEKIEELNKDETVHGVLLFRPLPKHLKTHESEIVNHLSPEKDVDCMTDLSNAGVYEGKALGFPPCTPEAVMVILKHYGYDLKGKNVTIIGRSLVVGKPLAMMLMGKHATITVCHTKTVNITEITKRSDIIVSSAGVLKSLTADFVSPGQTIIDVSINWDPEKKDGQGGIAGDADYEAIFPIVEAITPVPGGVGTVTTSVLMEHVVNAAEKSMERKYSGQKTS